MNGHCAETWAMVDKIQVWVCLYFLGIFRGKAAETLLY